MRYVTASIIVGPPPLRALSAAAFVTAYTARRSFPSTRTPSKPYARAFWARVFEAVCLETGTEMAHWLFLQKKIVGALKTPATFIPAWKSPSLVAPSPKSDRLRDLRADRAGDRHVVDVPRSVVIRHLPALLWILRVAVRLGHQRRDGEAAPEGGPRLSIRREHPVPLLEGHRAAHLGRF